MEFIPYATKTQLIVVVGACERACENAPFKEMNVRAAWKR